MADNTNNNLKYEQINWGWLNDYAGYKFAPITFFDNLYTEEGKSFKAEYNTTLDNLKNGKFVVGRAQTLATLNADGSSTLITTSPATTPVYFKNGIPKKCTSLEIDLTGNINKDGIGNYVVKASAFTGGSFSGSTITTSGAITASGKITGGSLEVTGAATISGALTTGSLQITSASALPSWSTPTTLVTLDGTTMKKSTMSQVVNNITSNVTINYPENDNDMQIAFKQGESTISRIRSVHTKDNDNRNTLYLTTYSPNNTSDWIALRIQNSDDNVGEIRPLKYTASNGNTTTGKNSGVKIYGAVWNDYAEYRDQQENIEPGYCVCSSDNGKVFKTVEKLAPCDGIVSDTFGFAIGDDDICQTPLAVAGRVLAYCEGDRMDYHAGDTVCASANGKVCKMTREEIREYPDRIVGIVSEIPEYEIWNNGIEVKGRIWVNVK